MSKKIGYVLLGFSFLLWGLIGLLPLTSLPNKVKIGLVLYAASYIVFFIAGYLLGKDVLNQLKLKMRAFLPKIKSKKDDEESMPKN